MVINHIEMRRGGGESFFHSRIKSPYVPTTKGSFLSKREK